MNLLQDQQERQLTRQEKTARTHLNHAVSLHLQGDKEGALKATRRALALDPTLVRDKLTRNLVQELTGLPAEEALARLSNASSSRILLKSAHEEERQAKPFASLSISVYALVTLLVVLVGMVIYGIAFGRFDNALQRLRLLQMEGYKHRLSNYEYYMIVPHGAPPDGGWPVVVALHGLGGEAREMIWMADEFTDVGAIFVAPTFRRYEPYPGNGPIDPMSQILKEINTNHAVQSRGAVLLGLSQGGTFAFRFAVHHPEQVYGVVTAGAPEYDQIIPARYNTPFIFTWGELDWLQEFVIPEHVWPLQNAGYNIQTYIVPGYGHEVSPFAIEQAIKMIR